MSRNTSIPVRRPTAPLRRAAPPRRSRGRKKPETGSRLRSSCRQSVDSLKAKMETSEKVPIFARLNVKGGIPSPLHNPPMRIEAFLHGFAYSLRGCCKIGA